MAQQDPNQTDIEQSAAETESVAEAVEEQAGATQAEATEEGASQPGAGQDVDSTDEEPSLEEVIAELQGEVAAARDQALRAQADAQNVKRRAEQDVEKARKFALEQFTKELLPVVDNLERALEAASASGGEASRSLNS